MTTTRIEYRVIRKNGEPYPSEWTYDEFKLADEERIGCDKEMSGAAPHSIQARVITVNDWQPLYVSYT